MGRDSLSSIYYKKGLENCSRNKMYNEVIWLYIINSKLFFNKGEIDSSLFYTNKAYGIWKKNSTSKTRLLSIYNFYYKIFNKLNDYKKANDYLNLFVTLQDSLNTATNSARYLQVLAESDYQKAKAELRSLETRNYFLLAIAISVFIFLVIVFTFYLRLKNAHKHLVGKSLEIAGADISYSQLEESAAFKNNNSSDSKIVTKEQIELIENLERFMKKEKPFLKNNISINDVALQLSSNRTYLSQAINMRLNKNFVSYINELRIKEAVRKISSGKYKEMTIEGISVEVGFNNRISFNSAFKKYTGILPSYFIRELSNRR